MLSVSFARCSTVKRKIDSGLGTAVGLWVRSNLTDFIVENTKQMNNQDLLIKIEASVKGGIGQQRTEISNILRREHYDTLSFKL